MSTLGASSPHPAIGRPQYASSAKARRRTRATSSRQPTRRGQARQTETRASSSARLAASWASRWTCRASAATGVSGVAGSSGQPLPGSAGPAGAGPDDEPRPEIAASGRSRVVIVALLPSGKPALPPAIAPRSAVRVIAFQPGMLSARAPITRLGRGQRPHLEFSVARR